MKFEDKYPDVPKWNPHAGPFSKSNPDPSQVPELIISRHDSTGKCWHCGEETEWLDLSFQTWMCSEECYKAKWDEYWEASAKSAERKDDDGSTDSN